ncbi:MAG: hypothetical protein IT301_16540 [Dehalococcoidia bacterium]|nr:hypothetical protein [Dehalococcoidia bacterium]
MTQLRLSVETFAKEIDAALAALGPGDQVLLGRSGQIVARMTAESVGIDWPAFIEKVRQLPPLGDDFAWFD